jgi:hypothetical protein
MQRTAQWLEAVVLIAVGHGGRWGWGHGISNTEGAAVRKQNSTCSVSTRAVPWRAGSVAQMRHYRLDQATVASSDSEASGKRSTTEAARSRGERDTGPCLCLCLCLSCCCCCCGRWDH